MLGLFEEVDMDFISSSYARKYIVSFFCKLKVDFVVFYFDVNLLVIDFFECILVFDF